MSAGRESLEESFDRPGFLSESRPKSKTSSRYRRARVNRSSLQVSTNQGRSRISRTHASGGSHHGFVEYGAWADDVFRMADTSYSRPLDRSSGSLRFAPVVGWIPAGPI